MVALREVLYKSTAHGKALVSYSVGSYALVGGVCVSFSYT